MNRNKIIGLSFLAIFAMLQISACFVAGSKTEGFISIFYYFLGGISCLFGLALDFLLLIMAIDVFGGVFGSVASNLGKQEETEEEVTE